MRGMVEVGTG